MKALNREFPRTNTMTLACAFMVGMQLVGCQMSTSIDGGESESLEAVAQNAQWAPKDQFWSTTYGGAKADQANDVVATSDGAVLAASTASWGSGDSDIYVLKIDKSGNKIWDKTLGGRGYEAARAIAATPDGGYVVVGETSSYGAGDADAYVVKLNAQGVYEWSRTFGGARYDTAKAVGITSDGGVVVAGYNESYGNASGDIHAVRLDSQGRTVWERTFGGRLKDSANSLTIATDGTILIAGYTQLTEDSMYARYVLKTDRDGNLLWSKAYANKPMAQAVIALDGGSFVIAGSMYSQTTRAIELTVSKLDKYGNEVWEKSHSAGADVTVNAFKQTRDGGYVAGGETFGGPTGRVYGAYVAKLDRDGNKSWDKIFGGSQSDSAWGVAEASEGGYYVAGYTYSYGAGDSDLYVLKVNRDGTCTDGGSPGRL